MLAEKKIVRAEVASVSVGATAASGARAGFVGGEK